MQNPRQVRSQSRQSALIHLENGQVLASRGTRLAAFSRVSFKKEGYNLHQQRWQAVLRLRSSILCLTRATSKNFFYCNRVYLYTDEMFQRHHLDTILYLISPNDIHLYEYQFQKNIGLFFFYKDENRARHPLVISRMNYERVANLLYWKEHYALITSIPGCLLILQNTSPKSIFVFDDLKTFHQNMFSRVIRNYAHETTLCQYSMCS